MMIKRGETAMVGRGVYGYQQEAGKRTELRLVVTSFWVQFTFSAKVRA